MRNKLIAVINGKGGAGKDTLCECIRDIMPIMNISSVDPIKAIARQHGWNGEKDDRSRRFLAELKRVFAEYNDLPTMYLTEKTKEFLESDAQVLFVHIREPLEIEKYRTAIAPSECVTILVRREEVHKGSRYGNAADDGVENYDYDVVFRNAPPLEDAKRRFRELISALMKA